MTLETDLNTRNPFGGFIVGGMDFLIDFDNFPINQELVDNFRRNAAGSRPAPDHRSRILGLRLDASTATTPTRSTTGARTAVTSVLRERARLPAG